MKNITFITLLLLHSTFLFAHRGGQEKDGPLKGCHANQKDQSFHCHSKSKYDGRKWPSRDQALRAIQGNTRALNKKKVEPSNKYNRKMFTHWTDFDRDCQNTRAEILIERSLTPVTYKKKKGCIVLSGKWKDFYYPEVHTSANKVDIDHVVPLKHAWDSGANNWTVEKRKKFANDPENLVITNLKYNRQKGAKTIMEWMPIHKAYACKYAKKWIYLKNKYHLKISKKEESYLNDLTVNCRDFQREDSSCLTCETEKPRPNSQISILEKIYQFLFNNKIWK